MIKKILLLYGLLSLFWLQAQSPGGVSTNLVGWYSADVSATATTWTDRSPAGNNLTGAGTPTFTNLLNFNTVATFNGTSQRYSIAATSATWPGTNTANTYYYVAVPTGTNTSRSVFGKGTGTTALNGIHSGKGTTATTLVSGATGAGTVNKTSVWSQNVPEMIRTGFNGGATGAHYLSDNGASESSAGSSNPTYAATSAFAVGSQNTAAGFWDGNIAEVIAYSGKHAAADYNRIESYLAVKYGITKAGNYINSASTTVWTTGGGYDNNIAGIGRDDLGGAANSGLNQKQSQSVNSGSQVVMALGTAAASNSANANTFTANQRFFIWGDDNGSLTTQVATGSNAYTYRFTRIWKTENTGSFAQNMTVYYPVSAFGNALPATVALLYGTSATSLSNGTASAIAQSGTTTINGASYYIFTVPSGQIANMQFFSFAGVIQAAPGGVFTNLALWLKADGSVSLSSGKVSTWNNLVTNSSITQQATNTGLTYNITLNSNSLNFNPGITFPGTSSAELVGLSNAGLWDGQLGIFSVGKELNNSGNLSGIFISDIKGMSCYNSVPNTFLSSDADGGYGSKSIDMGYNALLANVNYNQNANAYLSDSTFSNGYNYGLESTPLTSNVTTTTNFEIGGRTRGSLPNRTIQGDIPEVVVYNRNFGLVANASDRARINSYLAIKYGVTLDQTVAQNYIGSDGTTIFWNATTNTGYNNNIAGIGRDDISALYQKQSASQNSGIQPVIGNGNIFDTNANNTNTFSTDLSALVWGSDTGSTSFATSFVFGGLNSRMARIWKVQETGTVGTVKVGLPASQITGGISSLNLVVSSDATFDGTDTRTAMTLETLGGVQYYTATVNFTTGQFFSFAAFVTAPGGVLGSSLWLKADQGSSNATYFNVAAGSRTASSNFAGLPAANSTLGSSSSWSASSVTTGGYLTLDLGSVQTVYGVVTKGRGDGAQWVTSYTVSYSSDNSAYTSLGSFIGNYDQNTEVINMFAASINARYIRFTVTGYSTWPSMRADVVQTIPSVTADNSTVKAWLDQSGNNKSFSSAAGTVLYQTPSSNNKFNFNPSLNFSTTATSLSSSSSLFPASPVSSATLFGVSNTNGFISLRVNNSSETNAFAFYDYPIFGANFIFARPSTFSAVSASDTSVSGNIGRISTGSLISGTSVSVSVNGGGATSSTGAYSTNTGGMTIGSNTWAGGDDPGIVGNTPETIAYTQLLTLTEQQRVNTYLAVKYGITLSRNNDGDGTSGEVISGSILEGDYVASDGTTRIWNSDATYQNNIAGIGRDDTSALSQKQSQSVNSGSQVVMALGTAAASNQANANTITSDKQFFIWGDDNGSLTAMASTGNSTYNYRFTRVWKAQNTGSFAQNMTVYYPVTAFGNASSTTVALLYGTSAASLSNGTASAIAQSSTTTINGASYYIFTVPAAQVANMQFFSFAGTQAAPGGVTGSSLWVKADVGTGTSTDNTAITTWADQSGNSNDVSQGTAANRPLYRSNSANLMNFNPTVSFDGTNDYMDATTFTINGSTNTLFSAVRPNVVNVSQNILSFGAVGSNNGGEFRFVNATLQYGQNNGAFVSIASGSVLTAGAPLLFGSSMNNVANGANLYQNNRTITTGTIGQIPSAANLVSIGSRTIASRAQFFNGLIPEVVTYNSLLTAVQRQRVNSYLAIKYGTTMDQTVATNYLASDGTTILWDATANTSYNNNITGIGRDDLSALYQKQSQSVNTGSQVVMALGTVVSTNQANANTITSDKQFLIWGDDNGSLTTQVTTGNSTFTYRFTRVWKAQNTGSFAENMTVYYPVSAFGNALSTTVALLYGTSATSLSNGTASAIAQSSTTTINGASYYVFTVPSAQVANMQFFSFAGTITSPGGVTGEILWLKADVDLTPSSGTGTVTAWLDQSGLGNNITTVAGTPSRSSVLLNFNPSIDFNADNEGLAGTDLGMGADNTWGMFNVFAPTELVDGGDIMMLHELTGAVDRVEYTTTGGVYRFSGVTSFNTPSGLISLNKPMY
jgi:hypothetical protein